ncbi:methylglyoxal synthase [Desulfoluna sp.]|uniref:methylglyoxal synthase n=1 Tax=Desulfoluna sp. TaxID=2045199 RepID=UPI00262D714F|nr:methylglyoxal synthase [Desulfoluna sp.]
MEARKRIALVAHDEMKPKLIAWASTHQETLKKHELYGTGTTGGLLISEVGLDVIRFKSGPLGGDLEMGNLIVNDGLDIMIFFWDPMTAQPHDVDVKALLRISAVHNIPIACNEASADFFITSHLFNTPYNPALPDYTQHINRRP